MTSSVPDRPAGSQTIPHFSNVSTGTQTHPPMFGRPASVSRKVLSFSIFDAFLLTSRSDYNELSISVETVKKLRSELFIFSPFRS
jgi:hypothetical protein